MLSKPTAAAIGYGSLFALLGVVACSSGDDSSAEVEASAEAAAAESAPAEAAAAESAGAETTNPLLDANSAAMTETAPDVYRVRFQASNGEFLVEVTRAWAPRGADRFYNLVKNGFYDEARFFRVVSGFVVQFGINGDPAVSTVWRAASIQDDPPQESNTRGTVTFATSGPHSRTTQVFINFGDNSNLDSQGFAPFGQVVEGMATVDAIYRGYGGTPNQGAIQSQGNAYLTAEFPDMDYVIRATIE